MNQIAPVVNQLGQTANNIATEHIFEDYTSRRSQQTRRTQAAALSLWSDYLDHVSFPAGTASAYQSDPAAWQGITWGLVTGFVRWMLQRGYSINSINNRLSVVKTYANLAARAGVIPITEHAMIREVSGYSRAEAQRLDETRPQTRMGRKKAGAIVLTGEQAALIKAAHPATPQGIRDRLLAALLLDLGLRAGEAAALRVADFSEPGFVTVYRPKTDTVDKMELTMDLMQALADYAAYAPQDGRMLRGSRKDGRLTNDGLSARAINARVRLWGRDIVGVKSLSPHDLRHTWATRAAKNSSIFALRDAGGWSNMQTPGRYVERSQVVNEGIQLDY
ncbi:MAG TPA: site-specific integrase [Anaerolineae bacterium]|nr:site-specific integrase [Anaerolineae bacterium]